MSSFHITLAFMFCAYFSKAQTVPATHVYSELTSYLGFSFGQINDQGYSFVTTSRVFLGDSILPPGLLVQLDFNGEILHIDTLREHNYQFAHRVDSFLFLSSYHFYKYPDTLSTYVLEICDLHGKVIQSYSQDFIENIPFGSGVAQKNDSMYIFSQVCQLVNGDPAAVFYEVNTHSLSVSKRLASKGAILGKIRKIDDKPTFLEWTYGLWIKDTTFAHNNSVNTDSSKAFTYGTILPREDAPGWFGFGSCNTPSNYYGICMIALNDKLQLDKVDLLYHPPTNNNYGAASQQSICKSGEYYYAAGMWNEYDPAPFFWQGINPVEIVIAKYDLQLNRVWTKIVGGDRRYAPWGVHPTPSGGFMISGGLKDNFDGNKHKPFTMFFDADGELVGQEVPEAGRYEFTIYGNPGHEALRIMGRWPGRQVRLTVVNAMGSPMLSSFLNEGMNQFDTAWWPSGTYLLSITDESGRVLWSQPWIRQ
jgi:hypothetical protein